MNQNMTMEVAVFVPEGFDPNVLAELERIIPHIAGAISKEESKKSEPFSMVLSPDGTTAVLPMKEALSYMSGIDYEALLFEDKVFLRCDSNAILSVDGTDYLVGKAQILNIDDDGNDCGITAKQIADAQAFFHEAVTMVEFGGDALPALRLE